MSKEKARETALRGTPSATIASTSYFALCHTFQEAGASIPAILAFPYAMLCAILVYKLAGKQLSLYLRLRECPGVIGLFLFSLAGVLLLASLWFAALGIAGSKWCGILFGLGGTALSVMMESAITWWKTRSGSIGRRADEGRGVLDSGRSGDCDLLPLATYVFGIAMLGYTSFLLLGLQYGFWDGAGFGMAELTAFIPVILLGIIWFSALLATLVSPIGKGESTILFCGRSVLGAIALIGIVGYSIYQWVNQLFEGNGLTGIACLVVSSSVMIIALLRIVLRHDRQDVISQLTLILEVFFWSMTVVGITKLHRDNVWDYSPAFILFIAAMLVELIVSWKAFGELAFEKRYPVWEKDLVAYRHIGLFLAVLSWIAMLVWGNAEEPGQHLADGGDKTILADGAIQILLGVATVEYYIAFHAALRDRRDVESRKKKLQQRMYL